MANATVTLRPFPARTHIQPIVVKFRPCSINTVITPTPPSLLSTTVATNQITLTFDHNIILQSDASISGNWIVTSGSGYTVTVLSAVVSSNTNIIITTSNQTIGAAYTLTLPYGIISTDGLSYAGSSTLSFTGSGTAPTISYTRSVEDAYTMEIGFSDSMDINSTINRANYTIDNNLIVKGVTQINNNIFRIATSRQTEGVLYNVSVNNGPTGVKSIYGNFVQ